MKLYYKARACSLCSHILLHESGLPFSIESVDLTTKVTLSGKNFLEINPKGQVPTLEFDDGSILTEGIAIALYIADQAPEKQLIAPIGDINRYQAIAWFNFVATELHKNFVPIFYHASPEERSAAIEKLIAKFTIVEQILEKQDYLLGDRFSIADAYFYVVSRWRQVVSELPVFTAIDKFMQRVGERSSVQSAIAAEDKGI